MSEVLEGEIIETSRDVEVRVEALRGLPVENQVHAVTVMLSDARTRLLAATAVHDLPGIKDIKAQAATLQEITKQLRLGKEMQLDAAEFVRRAERVLGIAIRRGQERGEVRKPGQKTVTYNRWNGTRSETLSSIPGPTDLAPAHELQGANAAGEGIYAMTDGVSDEAFEEALADAKAEENLSRANVARKARAKASGESSPPPAQVDRKVRKTAGARKVMEDLLVTINGLVFIVKDTDPAEVDSVQHKDDIAEIWQGTNTIRRFLKLVEEN